MSVSDAHRLQFARQIRDLGIFQLHQLVQLFYLEFKNLNGLLELVDGVVLLDYYFRVHQLGLLVVKRLVFTSQVVSILMVLGLWLGRQLCWKILQNSLQVVQESFDRIGR